MEFHGILSRSKVPWNSMELFPHSRVPWNSMEFHGTFNFPPKSSMEFHGIPWNFFWSSMEFHGIPWNLINFIFKKIIFLNIVFGIWLMIRCYLAKISQKRYKLHWFQYRNSYFEHPSVSENGTRSAKMACCSWLEVMIWCKNWRRDIIWTCTESLWTQCFGNVEYRIWLCDAKCLEREHITYAKYALMTC